MADSYQFRYIITTNEKNHLLDGLLEFMYEHILILDNRDSDSAFFFVCMTLINGVLCLPMPFIYGLAGLLLVWIWERDNDTLYIIRVRVYAAQPQYIDDTNIYWLSTSTGRLSLALIWNI